MHISIIVILLSFEKFLSKYDAKYAKIQNIIELIPIHLPYTLSNKKPIKIPIAILTFEFVYNPKNNIYIINILGAIPAIFKLEKIFICTKYNKNPIKNNIIVIAFLLKTNILSYFFITNTEYTFEKSTAVCITAYLSVELLVVTISDIVPISIPFGYIPPNPEV